MSNSRQLIIDLDGTLLDSSARHYAVYELISKYLKISPISFSDYWSYRRNGLSNLEVLLKFGLEKKYHQVAQELWFSKIESAEMLNKDRLFPGVIEWLYKWNAIIDLVLITLRSNTKGLESQIKTFNLENYFFKILSIPHQFNGSNAKVKLAKENIEKNIIAWIGDSEVDIEAAKILGITAIGVSSGIRTGEALLNAGAIKLFDSITKIDLCNI